MGKKMVVRFGTWNNYIGMRYWYTRIWHKGKWTPFCWKKLRLEDAKEE